MRSRWTCERIGGGLGGEGLRGVRGGGGRRGDGASSDREPRRGWGCRDSKNARAPGLTPRARRRCTPRPGGGARGVVSASSAGDRGQRGGDGGAGGTSRVSVSNLAPRARRGSREPRRRAPSPPPRTRPGHLVLARRRGGDVVHRAPRDDESSPERAFARARRCPGGSRDPGYVDPTTTFYTRFDYPLLLSHVHRFVRRRRVGRRPRSSSHLAGASSLPARAMSSSSTRRARPSRSWSSALVPPPSRPRRRRERPRWSLAHARDARRGRVRASLRRVRARDHREALRANLRVVALANAHSATVAALGGSSTRARRAPRRARTSPSRRRTDPRAASACARTPRRATPRRARTRRGLAQALVHLRLAVAAADPGRAESPGRACVDALARHKPTRACASDRGSSPSAARSRARVARRALEGATLEGTTLRAEDEIAVHLFAADAERASGEAHAEEARDAEDRLRRARHERRESAAFDFASDDEPFLSKEPNDAPREDPGPEPGPAASAAAAAGGSSGRTARPRRSGGGPSGGARATRAAAARGAR